MTPEQAGNPRLVYNSTSVSIRPIVQATIQSSNTAPLPATITVQLTWDNIAGSPRDYGTSGLNPGDLITVAGQVPNSVTVTGRHTYSLRVTIPGQADQVISGYTYVVVQDNSPFGAGWTFSVTDKLIDIPLDAAGPAGKLRAFGTGEWRFYEDVGGGAFRSPAEDNGTLVRNPGNTFTYTTPEGVKRNFDADGNQSAIVSADGKETISFAFSSNLLMGMTAIDGSATTFFYTNGYLSSIATVGPRTFTISNPSGNLMQITNPDGGIRSFSYDGSDRMTSETFDNLQNQWGYNPSNERLGQITWGSTASPSVFTLVPSIVQGLSALVRGKPRAFKTDPRSAVTQWQFDNLGRPLVEIAADGGTTNWVRDTAGRVTSTTDPIGRVTNYTRDSLGYVTFEYLPGTELPRKYEYQTAFHAMTKYTDERGNITDYTYDPANGHLLTKVVRNNGALETTSFGYNPATGLLETVTDPMRTTTYQYDIFRRLWTQTTQLATTTLGYDMNGHLSTMHEGVAGRPFHNYSYDAMGRILSHTDPNGATESWLYTGAGSLVKYTDRMFSSTTYQFDMYNRGLVEVTVEAALTGVSRTKLQRYNFAGQLEKVRDPVGAWSTITLDSVGRPTYIKDALGRTSRNVYDLAGQRTFAWDQMGRPTGFEYHARGWVTRTMDGYANFWETQHDAAGNVTRELDPLNHGPAWDYDEQDRVKSYNDGVNGNYTVSYWGDDGDNAWGDFDANGNLVTRRLYEDATDALFARIGAGGTDWYLTDRLGSVRDLMDNASTVRDHLDYSAFGKVLTETNPSYGDRYKYTAREFDGDVANLGYYRARWYSADIGQFMSEDPLGFAAGDANLRRYVGNEATNATDPSGLQQVGPAVRPAPPPVMRPLPPAPGPGTGRGTGAPSPPPR